jgi:ribonucleotide monophosphatase NagD (HAD superfamily)
MWLDHYRGLLCDLDGCLVAGGRPLPGARALVAYARDRLIVVSNNSTDTPTTLAAKLARLNLPIAPERIVLAGAWAFIRFGACRSTTSFESIREVEPAFRAASNVRLWV